jgi:hypothetical protein
MERAKLRAVSSAICLDPHHEGTRTGVPASLEALRQEHLLLVMIEESERRVGR